MSQVSLKLVLMIGEEYLAKSLAKAGVTAIFGVIGIPVVGFATECQKAGPYYIISNGFYCELELFIYLVLLIRTFVLSEITPSLFLFFFLQESVFIHSDMNNQQLMQLLLMDISQVRPEYVSVCLALVSFILFLVLQMHK